MKVFVVDISGKVVNYDIALCEALADSNQAGVSLEFFCPLYEEHPHCKTSRLLNLIPHKYKTSLSLWKRMIKMIELFLNYHIILLHVLFRRPDIIHFQWFPLLEKSSFECYMVKILKWISPRTKTVLTIHNIFPHESSPKQIQQYSQRFGILSETIDSFIVHTEKSKEDVCSFFGLERNRVFVIHHGIFVPNNYKPSVNDTNSGTLTFIMYGNLSYYKGVDVFIEAIKLLPQEYRAKMKAVIAGNIQDDKLRYIPKEFFEELNIDWHPYFLPEKELYERIDDANVIVLPYRQISQSGVLLLALYFRRLIVTSDLPSFKETLQGFSDDMFFESENPQSLANLMMKYIDGKVDCKKQIDVIENLNAAYSWEKAADKTYRVYNSLM